MEVFSDLFDSSEVGFMIQLVGIFYLGILLFPYGYTAGGKLGSIEVWMLGLYCG